MEVLYHYCSPAVFREIVANRGVWLSSVTQSNDYLEGRLVAMAVSRLAQADELEAASSGRIGEVFARMEGIADGLCFCLSEEGDLLSQWRGYAADARGVAIGFKKDYLESLVEQSRTKLVFGLGLHAVKYGDREHEELVRPTYEKMKEKLYSGKLQALGRRGLLDTRTDQQVVEDDEAIRVADWDFSGTALDLFGHLFLLKSHAFTEEREWRLLSYMTRFKGDKCSFRAVADQIIPYRQVPLAEMGQSSIAEVILGPKHTTPVAVVENFLELNGFRGVRVRKSIASYR